MNDIPAQNPSIQFCQLCAKRQADSKEHLPIQSTGNMGDVLVNFVDGCAGSGDMQYHTFRSTDGFWVPALCKRCNNRTGRRYGSSYADLVSQISSSIPIIVHSLLSKTFIRSELSSKCFPCSFVRRHLSQQRNGSLFRNSFGEEMTYSHRAHPSSIFI